MHMGICVEIPVLFHKFILGTFKTITYGNTKIRQTFSAGVLEVTFC